LKECFSDFKSAIDWNQYVLGLRLPASILAKYSQSSKVEFDIIKPPLRFFFLAHPENLRTVKPKKA
jgi:hypothetical protein